MTADPPGTATPQLQTEGKPSIAIPLIVWLLIQLAAIALAASGVPLSANFPRPPQSLAVHEMLIAQFVGSAIFLPVLFRGGWRTWLGMIATAGPMLLLAGWLARMPISRAALLWVDVAMWLTMLALWRATIRSDADHTQARGLQSPGFLTLLTAIALLLSAGGLLFWYLHAEFAPDRPFPLLNLFPLPALLHSVTDTVPKRSPLLSTAALSAAALVILAAKAIRRREKRHLRELQTTHPTT